MAEHSDVQEAFLRAATVPLDQSHASGDLRPAHELLSRDSSLESASIYTAAALGNPEPVATWLRINPALATTTGGPHQWDPLTTLCFSRFLRLDPIRRNGFLQSAGLLLDAGADPNTGFWSEGHEPHPVFESALYGAAGVAHDPDLTRLLLRHGANPNDEETPYHAPETHDNATVRALLESGRLTDDSLATMLLRKADWHDGEGVRLLLEHGADPNRMTPWGFSALHQSIRRDNALDTITLLLDHGADPALRSRHQEQTAVVMAAHRGRGDVLSLFRDRGVPLGLAGRDALIAACALGERESVNEMARSNPAWGEAVMTVGVQLLTAFAGVGNTAGVECLLDLGVPVDAPLPERDGYWELAAGSTALHVAAWRARHDTVHVLVSRGARVSTRDGAGHTPLQLAVKACTSSWWQDRRQPHSVAILLEAGADAHVVPLPTGYPEVDRLLEAHRT